MHTHTRYTPAIETYRYVGLRVGVSTHVRACVMSKRAPTPPQAHRARRGPWCTLARQRKEVKALPNYLTSASHGASPSRRIKQETAWQRRASLRSPLRWLNCLSHKRLPPPQVRAASSAAGILRILQGVGQRGGEAEAGQAPHN